MKKIKPIPGEFTQQVLEVGKLILREKKSKGEREVFTRTEVKARFDILRADDFCIGHALRRLGQQAHIHSPSWLNYNVREYALGFGENAEKPEPATPEEKLRLQSNINAKHRSREAAKRAEENAILAQTESYQALKLAPKIRDSQHPVALWALRPRGAEVRA